MGKIPLVLAVQYRCGVTRYFSILRSALLPPKVSEQQ